MRNVAGRERRRFGVDRSHDRVGHAAGDVGLQRQDLGDEAVVGVGPQMCLRRSLDEARRNPHPRAIVPCAAFNDIPRLERLADVTRALEAVLVEHRRRAADDREPALAHSIELHHQFFGEPVAERIEPDVIAHAGERQHDEAWPRCDLSAATPVVARRRNESVTTPRYGFDEPRPSSVVAERHSEPPNRRVEAVLEVDESAVGPEAAAQLVTRHDLSRVLQKQTEHLERLILQSDACRPVAQLARSPVQLEAADTHQIASLAWHVRPVWSNRRDPREYSGWSWK